MDLLGRHRLRLTAIFAPVRRAMSAMIERASAGVAA
jgi:hypothetical protein